MWLYNHDFSLVLTWIIVESFISDFSCSYIKPYHVLCSYVSLVIRLDLFALKTKIFFIFYTNLEILLSCFIFVQEILLMTTLPLRCFMGLRRLSMWCWSIYKMQRLGAVYCLELFVVEIFVLQLYWLLWFVGTWTKEGKWSSCFCTSCWEVWFIHIYYFSMFLQLIADLDCERWNECISWWTAVCLFAIHFISCNFEFEILERKIKKVVVFLEKS